MALQLTDQARMVAALRRSLREPNAGDEAALIETHISFILLAGTRAYKIKKAVNLGFVDFTTPALRRHFCEEELRLNRRTAPGLYLGVLPVTGTPEQPAFDREGGAGPAIDWVLEMRAFAQDDLWDRLAARGALHPGHVDELVEVVGAFHEHAAVAASTDPYGSAAQVRVPVQDTLRALDKLCTAAADRARLDALGRWESQAFDALHGVFDERLRDGRVRECHGDLHLGNVTLVDGRTTLFDALEFDPALRWTDVMSDVAFMAMDLQAHGLAWLGHRFVNGIIERSGDAGGLRVLRYQGVYRAMVRAKVAALRATQRRSDASVSERQDASDAVGRYLDVALSYGRQARPMLILTHGCSGSGKTLATHSLLECSGAIRFRADVERKRLFGLAPLAHSDPAQKARLYSAQATEATQARLREAAALALGSGYNVILDATFGAHEQREQARALAARMGAGFVIIDFRAHPDTLRQRVAQRALRNDDASEADLAVLEGQLASAEPLRETELPAVFAFDAEPAIDQATVGERWAPLLRTMDVAAP